MQSVFLVRSTPKHCDRTSHFKVRFNYKKLNNVKRYYFAFRNTQEKYWLSSARFLVSCSKGSQQTAALCLSELVLSRGSVVVGTFAWNAGPILILLKIRGNKKILLYIRRHMLVLLEIRQHILTLLNIWIDFAENRTRKNDLIFNGCNITQFRARHTCKSIKSRYIRKKPTYGSGIITSLETSAPALTLSSSMLSIKWKNCLI